jgi:hypothetical protein
MDRSVVFTNLTELECSYERKLLSYMQPDEFKTFRDVSEVGGTQCIKAIACWLQLVS